MDLTERLRAWSYGRQCLGRAAHDVEEALRAVVGVYSVHPTAPLTLAARAHYPTAAGFAGAYRRLDSDRTALRIPAMRMSLFLVPRRSAARLFTATRRSAWVVRTRAASIGLSPADYERLAELVVTQARVPLPQTAFEAATGLRGASLGRLLRTLRVEGRLLALGGDHLRTGDLRYVATVVWAPEGLDAGQRADALAWLAGEYLAAFGPARVEDFSWWCGVSRRDAAAALDSQATVSVGEGLLLRSLDEPAFDGAARLSGALALLPQWDAYTMGYAPDGRARFADPHLQDRLYTTAGDRSPGATSGDALPAVLVDGQAVGTWTLTVKDGPGFELFDRPGPVLRRRLEERLGELASLLAL